jgi:hypothetical protein
MRIAREVANLPASKPGMCVIAEKVGTLWV